MHFNKLELTVLLAAVFGWMQAHAAITPAAPEIKATAYLIMDYNSGRILAEKEIDKRVEPASLTKMMTTYVITEEIEEGNLKLDEPVMISEKAWRMEGSRMFVEVNKTATVEELLKGVIIQSGNDASVALAEHVAGTEEVFAQVMNEYAARLGMTNTNFTNSTGLPDPNHYTTARDLSILASAMIRDHPQIYAWHSIREYTYNGIKQPNRNLLLDRDDSVDGIKTGHTEAAGYCLVVSAEREGMRLVSVVMGTEGMEARARASQALLNYAFRFFETHKLYSANESVATGQVWKGQTDVLNLGLSGDLWVTVPRGQYKQLKPVVDLTPQILAPVAKDSMQGNIRIMLGDEEIAARPLLALDEIGEGSIIDRLKDEVRLLFQ
jgi:D-alanyl-D-alanine carboxypeptidase (penicillin-binding protein 5/6)